MSKAEEIITATIEGGAKLLVASKIPVLGPTIVSIWDALNNKQIERKIKRLEEFVSGLNEKSELISTKLNEEYVRKDDVLDICEQVIGCVTCERSEIKREKFRHIFINSIISKDCNYDKTEKYLKLIDRMGELEVQILMVFQNPERANKASERPISNPNEHYSGSTVWGPYYCVDILGQILSQRHDDIVDSLHFLEMERLIIDNAAARNLKTNGHPIHTLDNMLTNKGKEFIHFISEPIVENVL